MEKRKEKKQTNKKHPKPVQNDRIFTPYLQRFFWHKQGSLLASMLGFFLGWGRGAICHNENGGNVTHTQARSIGREHRGLKFVVLAGLVCKTTEPHLDGDVAC